MKHLIFSDWNFMRVLRLVIGIAVMIQAVLTKDVFFGLAGFLFTGMVIFNLGCCGTGRCYTTFKKPVEPAKDITYEEVV